MKRTSIALVSCAGKPQIRYPMLPAPGSKEKTLDCAMLTDLIEKADAIRWSIRDSGVHGLTGKGHEALVAVDILAAMARPPDNTGRPSVFDLDLLASLRALDQKNQDRKIKQKELLASRTTLLDALRDPASLQPPALVNSVSPAQ
jgi:hypothetical protein